MNIINIIGLAFAVAILVLCAKCPLRPEEERATAASVIRGIGFYGSLFLLGFNLGILELDAESGGTGSVDFVELFWIWAALGLLLTGAYVWVHLLVAKKGEEEALSPHRSSHLSFVFLLRASAGTYFRISLCPSVVGGAYSHAVSKRTCSKG